MSYRIAQKKHLLLALVASFVMLSVLTLTNKVHAAYDGARIIDNAVFLDSTTMSRTDIQNFLASKGSGLAGRSFTLNCYGQDSKERQWYTAVGAPCDQNIPASHIIYYSSQIYGVNPRVVIATLQKEQSLITSPNPTSWQLNQAMGYACPTSGQCSGSSNFFYQIDSGIWALRYHYERARGNMNWWSPSSSWVCGTEKNYYKPSLYPNQTVRFYDQNNVNYRNYVIANAATSAMYCYTPHAYNNPQGLYGRPAFGTVGMYYSGSYNFVYWFESWFGSTRVGAYVAQFYRHSSYPITLPGKTTKSFIDYKNMGLNSWYEPTNVPSGQKPITLATTRTINRSSIFGQTWGRHKNRPAVVFSKVYESNGTTLSNNQDVVKPGQIARFEFTFTVPSGTTPGKYREYFQPILEGSSSWSIGGLAWLDVTVEKPSYIPNFVSQSTYPTIARGTSRIAFISYKNNGNQNWYEPTNVPSGQKPITLATTRTINRSSIFGQTWGRHKNRPAVVFSKVYESNGTTLSNNQDVVKPGQIARFEFTFTVPSGTTPGKYREYFQPILEGSSSWSIGGLAWLDVTVE